MEVYGRLWTLTRSMLDAARNNAWDDLVEIEKKRAELLDELAKSDVSDITDLALNARKAELIRNILACDEETRILTESWMVELRQILDSIGTEKKLNDTYAGNE